MSGGPLHGLRVLEIAGIGPGPMCAMLLADLGAEVLRIDRTAPSGLGVAMDPAYDVMNRGRRSVAMDLKTAEGVALLLDLVARADALIEGFRPGVAERLGFGPDICLQRNPRLVYGRMTGWGQTGPLAEAAGHDINYIALAGALGAMGRRDAPPAPPLNLVGDFGGGALYLAFGIMAALYEAARSGAGQVVDAAMVDGIASLTTMFHGMMAAGLWDARRREGNLLDGGAPFYDVYETSDGKYIAIGALEGKFYRELIARMGLEDAGLPAQMDRARWPEIKSKFAETFASRSRAEWQALLEGSDVCFAPVLSLDEAAEHPHMRARENFIEIGGVRQPAPAPRFSRTPPPMPSPPPHPGADSRTALADWGVAEEKIADAIASGIVMQPEAE